jgi:hypothetical protein
VEQEVWGGGAPRRPMLHLHGCGTSPFIKFKTMLSAKPAHL